MKVFLEGVALRWKTIAGTTVTLAGIFTFILYHYIGLKNEQISVLKEKHAHLEMRIKDLSEHGPFPQTAQKINESIKEIQKKLIPLSTLYIFDPLSGMAELGAEGGMRAIFSTRISLKIKEAYNFINQKNMTLHQDWLMI